MTARGQKVGRGKGSITLHLSPERLRKLKSKALASQSSVSAYVGLIIDEADSEPCPALAALGALISLHATVEDSGKISEVQLSELEKLVASLSAAARQEVIDL